MFKPVIIIGAGRSGTNILRDVLTSVEGFETWPCDEINYIWRHGNITEPTDEFNESHARPKVEKYVRSAFKKMGKSSGASTIVEKTCANTLRVPFINDIFPKAQFIHIIRDGRDVVNSARKRWTAELNVDYILKKVRYIPISDIPYYGAKYFGNRLHKLFSNDNSLASWGPRFEGIDKAVQNYSLEEVCAIQWKRCTEKATKQLSAIDPDRVYTVYYENFALETKRELKKLFSFLKISDQNINLDMLSSMVHANSEGKWKRELSETQIESVNAIIESTLKKLGYKNKK